MPEKVIIIGSGPAGWTAAIYAARANLQPLVYEGAVTEENRIKGTTPLGQLNLTTEVENFPSWPAGDTKAYLKSALPEDRRPYWVQGDKPAPSHGINGPELMALTRQQAVNFGTRVESKDIVKIDLKNRPFTLFPNEGPPIQAHTVIIATGARANYLGLPSEDKYKNRGVSACAAFYRREALLAAMDSTLVMNPAAGSGLASVSCVVCPAGLWLATAMRFPPAIT